MVDLSLLKKEAMVHSPKKEGLVHLCHHWAQHFMFAQGDPVVHSLDRSVSGLPLLLYSRAGYSLLMNKISLGVLGCTRLKIFKCCSLECVFLLMGP